MMKMGRGRVNSKMCLWAAPQTVIGPLRNDAQGGRGERVLIGVLVSGKSAAGPEQTDEREAGGWVAECPTGTVVSIPARTRTTHR